jgi:hypothetical protein
MPRVRTRNGHVGEERTGCKYELVLDYIQINVPRAGTRQPSINAPGASDNVWQFCVTWAHEQALSLLYTCDLGLIDELFSKPSSDNEATSTVLTARKDWQGSSVIRHAHARFIHRMLRGRCVVTNGRFLLLQLWLADDVFSSDSQEKTWLTMLVFLSHN